MEDLSQQRSCEYAMRSCEYATGVGYYHPSNRATVNGALQRQPITYYQTIIHGAVMIR